MTGPPPKRSRETQWVTDWPQIGIGMVIDLERLGHSVPIVAHRLDDVATSANQESLLLRRYRAGRLEGIEVAKDLHYNGPEVGH